MKNNYLETKQTYEKNADVFAAKWKDTNIQNNEKIEKFIGYLKKGAKILDIGAGFGKDVSYFCDKGFDCIGFDFCDEFIKRSKELYDNVKILKMDFLHIDFPDNSFDALWSRGALFHISKSDFAIVIKKLSRILKNEGIFYLQLKEGYNDNMLDRIGNVEGQAYYAYYSKEELNSIMQQNGFELINEYFVEGWLNHYYKLKKNH